LEALRAAIAERLRPELADHELALPPQAARLRAQLFARHAVRAERLDEQGVSHLRVSMPYERLRGLCVAAGVAPPVRPGVIEDWEPRA
jgi:GTPase